MIRFLYLVAVILFAYLSVYAQYADDNYQELSKKSSQELLEEGRKFFAERQKAKALSRFLIVSQRYKTSNDREEVENSIRALNNAGCVYKYLFFDYVSAYESFTKAYNLCEEIGYDSFLPVIMVNMGDILNDYGTIHNSDTIVKQAEQLFEKCFNHALKTNNWDLLTTAFFNISNMNYDIDLSKYRGLMRKDISDTIPDIVFIRLQYKGIEKLQQKKYAESRDFFEKQFDAIGTRWEPDRERISVHLNIAYTYAMEGDYMKEAEQLEKALDISEKADMQDLTADIARQLSLSYGKSGNVEAQQKLRLLYLEKMEEMRNSRLENIAELKYLNDLKAEEEKARQLLYRQARQRNVIVAIIVILIITIIFFAIIWKKNRKLRASSKNLYEKYQKLLEAESSRIEKKYSKSNLNEYQREELIARIRKVLETPEIICRQDFSSKELAKMVDSNTSYVSQVINETFGMSFSSLLGNYRVKEACRNINESDRFDLLTIEGIANNVGFKSRTTFLNAFKREVGLSPSEYIKLAKEAKEKHL